MAAVAGPISRIKSPLLTSLTGFILKPALSCLPATAASDGKSVFLPIIFLASFTEAESVFEEPCKSWNDILRVWSVVPHNQKDVTFDFDILSVSDNVGIANWKVTRTLLPSNEKQFIDGIFQVSLNKHGLCTYFKQWRAVKRL